MPSQAHPTTIIPDEPRLNLAQAARELGLHRTTVLNLIHSRQLRATKVGKRWCTYRAWINEYLLSRQNVADDSRPTETTIVLANDEAAVAEGLARHGVVFAD